MMNRKTLIAPLVIISLCAASALAEKAGDTIYDVGLGFGAPISGLDLTRFGGGGESAGGTGFALSPQYLYQTSPELAVGVELTYMNFPAASVSLPGGPAASNGDLLGGEAVARYLFSPDGRWSPYATVGVGAARYAVTVQQGGTTVLDTASTGVTFFPGVGVKADVGGHAQVSAEARWQAGTVSRSDFGTGFYNIFALFLRLGWRA